MTTTATINLNDEDLFLAMTGACSYFYSWYKQFDYSHTFAGRPIVVVTMETGEETKAGTPTFATRTINAPLMRRALERLISEGQPTICSVNWSDPECDSEVDADVADVMFQYIILGDVVFG
jgi:hypothetical protein